LVAHNLLVLSDVHLGSDLVHAVQPDAPRRESTADGRDHALAGLFDWYRERRQGGRPWKLVIAGDFVDFVGMSVSAPDSGISTPLDPSDVELGLGGAEDHTIYKLRCVARRHAQVFASLARFLAAGNTLVVVRGNHDVDFHWPAVQSEFIAQLSAHAPVTEDRVQFSPWFYYEEGRVFVEHGHQYDRYCSHENMLHPVSPRDERRSQRSLSDILLRQVVRPTRGLLETGHERATAVDYIVFGARLGIGGLVGLAARFALAVGTLFSVWRSHQTQGALRVREKHEGLMSELATRLGLGLDRLRALSSLQIPPVTTSFMRLARTVMLDRILFGVSGTLALLLAVLLAPAALHAGVAVSAVVGVLFVVNAVVFRGRHDIEPSKELRDRAARVATLFPAAFVVMGHTHLPEVHEGKGSPSVYVNLGAWAGHVNEESGSNGAEAPGAASRTHFVLLSPPEEGDGCGGSEVAELRVWDTASGPRKFVSVSAPAPKG
jgi:UDP-2,3-diacylglucosamine pyrophosphatase LpxH